MLVNDELTRSFPFQIGVFQGCTLSTMLFDTAFNTVFQRVSHMLKSDGYHFSDAEVIKVVLGYADDIANITAKMQHNKKLLM